MNGEIHDLTEGTLDVTEDEVVKYVQEHGFPKDGLISDNEASAGYQIVIYDTRQNWEVYYTERGDKSDSATFPNREAAVREVVRRLLQSV